jgi:hypothetical protein
LQGYNGVLVAAVVLDQIVRPQTDVEEVTVGSGLLDTLNHAWMHEVAARLVVDYSVGWFDVSSVCKVPDTRGSQQKVLFRYLNGHGLVIFFNKLEQFSRDVSRAYARGSFELLKTTFLCQSLTHVCAIGTNARVISMGIVLAVKRIKDRFFYIVGHIRGHLANILARLYDKTTLLMIQDCWALNLCDSFIAVNASHKHIA